MLVNVPRVRSSSLRPPEVPIHSLPLPIFMHGPHFVVADAAGIPGVVGMDRELLRPGVEPAETAEGCQPQDSCSVLEYRVDVVQPGSSAPPDKS